MEGSCQSWKRMVAGPYQTDAASANGDFGRDRTGAQHMGARARLFRPAAVEGQPERPPPEHLAEPARGAVEREGALRMTRQPAARGDETENQGLGEADAGPGGYADDIGARLHGA